MKNSIFTTAPLLAILMLIFFSITVHSQRIVLVNDTVTLVPGIPKTVNLLAKDIIPAGDSIRFIGGGCENIYITEISPGVFTYVARLGSSLKNYGTD